MVATLQLVRTVEKQLIEYITENNYVVDIDVKKVIVNVLESMMVNPKLRSVIDDDDRLSTMLLEMLKKYVNKVKLNDDDSEESFETNYEEMQASRKTLDNGSKPIPTRKRIILDSNHSEILGGSSMRYHIEGGLNISKFRVPLITIKSVDKINSTHVFVQCRQLRRSDHRTHDKYVDCIGAFTMQTEINHNDRSYTYTFKSVDDTFLTDLNLTLYEVDFKIISNETPFDLVNVFKATNSSLQVEDGKVFIEGEFGDLTLQDGDDVLIQTDKNHNLDILKCKINQSTDTGIQVELPDEANAITDLTVDNVHCIVNKCVIFMDYFEE